jgi:hypothetical protein
VISNGHYLNKLMQLIVQMLSKAWKICLALDSAQSIIRLEVAHNGLISKKRRDGLVLAYLVHTYKF